MYHWPGSHWWAATATAAATVQGRMFDHTAKSAAGECRPGPGDEHQQPAAYQKRSVATSSFELAYGERPVLISHKEHGPIGLETRQLREHRRKDRAHQHVPETNDERSEDDSSYRQRGRPEPKYDELCRPREHESAHQDSLASAQTGLSRQRPEHEADATTADRYGYAPPRPCERPRKGERDLALCLSDILLRHDVLSTQHHVEWHDTVDSFSARPQLISCNSLVTPR